MMSTKNHISVEEQQALDLDQQARLQLADLFGDIISRNYLRNLSECQILDYEDVNNSQVRWLNITKIVIEKDTFFPDSMSMLYMALHHVAKTVSLVINKQNNKIELFLGARDFSGSDNVSGDILENGLKGFLPGVKAELHKKGVPINKYKETYVSCVSGLASLRDDKKDIFVQGIEKLINSTSAFPEYTAFFLADNVSHLEAQCMIASFNDLHNHLSPLAETQLTISESETKGTSHSITESFSKSISRSTSHTVTNTESFSESHTHTTGKNGSNTVNKSTHILRSLWSGIFGGESGTSESEGWNESDAFQEGHSTSRAKGDTTGETEQEQNSTGTQDTTNQSATEGSTRQVTFKNNQVKVFLEIIDNEVERLRNGIPFGLWSTASYFIASDSSTAETLASIYRGCIVGEESSHESYGVNVWTDESQNNQLIKYLLNVTHPRFDYKGINVSAGSVVTSKELAIHLSLPQSSVPGILVREEQSFGRNIISNREYNDKNSICIGNILHLGEEDLDNQVSLSIEELTKHVFVTGTTGSGKSNTLYQLISTLIKLDSSIENNKIKFLIIEPAKGEYKHIFGNKDDVEVYSSNPKVSKLLTINPFTFPEDVDIYEHIDSLVEVFNACWPMYAAMPQVLKHSIIEAYKSCGWDLYNSYNPDNIFPTIDDVLDSLKEFINSSEYSSDTKGDYKGSLETRLLSLCEGTVGRMFNETPIPDEELFNRNVIIDLSRVKSSETKSLIMGLLILKLNEFRASEKTGMNTGLRHVTILEEAHNLLKRTNSTQSAETANLAGMAVEKIANSMAEMRTNGECFVIADQSPSLLDLAAIRNTNTKIVMALPEKEDREIAGKSIGLDEKHIDEITKLKTGEAIVYQSGWEEAVKAKITYFETKNCKNWDYHPFGIQRPFDDSITELAYFLIDKFTSVSQEFDYSDILPLLTNKHISGGRMQKIKSKLNSIKSVTSEDIAFIFATIIGTDIFESSKSIKDVDIFNSHILRQLANVVNMPPDDPRCKFLVTMYLKGINATAQNPFYEGWLQSSIKNENYD